MNLYFAALICALVFVGRGLAQDSKPIPACSQPVGKWVGLQLRLILPKGTSVKKGFDVDYGYYTVSFSGKPRGTFIRGIYGPMASSGEVPKTQLSESTDVTSQIRTFKDIKINDVRGKLANGNVWRFIGMFSEQIEYYDVPKDQAAALDTVLDQLCFTRSSTNEPK